MYSSLLIESALVHGVMTYLKANVSYEEYSEGAVGIREKYVKRQLPEVGRRRYGIRTSATKVVIVIIMMLGCGVCRISLCAYCCNYIIF